MDDAEDYTDNEEESLEVKFSRLNASIAHTLETVKLAQSRESLSAGHTPMDLTAPGERKLNLRFPTPVYQQEYSPSDSDQGQENNSFDSRLDPQTQIRLLSQQLERVSMQLEEVTTSAPVTFSEADITGLRTKLDELETAKSACIPLGPILVIANMIERDRGPIFEENVSWEMPGIEEEGEDVLQSMTGEVEMKVSGVREENLGSWRAENEFSDKLISDLDSKRGILQSAWEDMMSQRQELKLVEKFLAEKEQALQIQTAKLARQEEDLTLERNRQDLLAKERFSQAQSLRNQLETLLIDNIESTFSLGPQIQCSSKRKELQAELDALRTQIEAVKTIGGKVTDAQESLESAEEFLMRTIAPGKFAVRLSAVKNQLLQARIQISISRNQKKTTSLKNMIETLAAGSQMYRARGKIKQSVLRRCATRPSSPVGFGTVHSRAAFSPSEQLLERRIFSPMRSQSPFSRASPDSLFATCSSIPLSKADAVYSEDDLKRFQDALSMTEARLERWKALARSLQAKLELLQSNEQQRKIDLRRPELNLYR